MYIIIIIYMYMMIVILVVTHICIYIHACLHFCRISRSRSKLDTRRFKITFKKDVKTNERNMLILRRPRLKGVSYLGSTMLICTKVAAVGACAVRALEEQTGWNDSAEDKVCMGHGTRPFHSLGRSR